MPTVKKKSSSNVIWDDIKEEDVIWDDIKEEDVQWEDEVDESDVDWSGETQAHSSVREFGKNVLKSTKRLAGIGFGAINSPLAFVWGSQAAEHLNPEEWQKLPHHKKVLVAAGGGFESAWRSISREGDWGTLAGEYHKAATGQTVEESLPEGLKWTAPTIEFLVNLISDPVIAFGEAARLAQLSTAHLPKNWSPVIPKGVLQDIARIEKLEKAERKALQERLIFYLKTRKDYIKWWEEQAPAMEHAQRLRETTAASKAGLEARVGVPTPKPKPAPATAIARELPTPTPTTLPYPKPRFEPYKAPVEELKSPRPKISTAEPRVEVPTPQQASRYKVAYAKASGGLILGVDQDDQGNLTYDVKKGLLGTMLVAGAVHYGPGVKEKFAQTLSENPAWAKVHGMVGDPKSSFKFSGLLSRLNTMFFDRFGPLKKRSMATYNAARTFASHKDVALEKFDELKSGLKPVRDSEVVFTDYVDAHRAYTRAKRGLKNPNGVTLGDARQAIEEIERHYVKSGKNIEDLRGSLEAFQQWTHDYILKEARDSGIISENAYQEILRNNKWYATFDVLDQLPTDIDKIPNMPSSEYFSVANQNVIKKMKGTEKQIANPIEATVKKFMNAQATYARNRVASTFIDDPGTRELFRPVATSEKEFGILTNQGKNPVMEGAWSKKEFGTINRFKDGKVERYIVPIEIAEAMKQLQPWQAPRFIHTLNALFRKTATTVYLPFTISNAMRDGLMAYTTAPVYKKGEPLKFAKDWTKGFWEGAKHEFLGSSDLVQEYVRHGGGFGYVGDLRQANLAKSQLFKKGMIRKSGDIIFSPFKLIEKLSATVELAPRLGTFDRAKMLGLSADDAALIARQATIDFNRGGTYTKVVNQFVPFLNARVQGRVTVASALMRDPKQTLGKAFVATVIPGMAAYAWNRLYYSKEYDDIPEYIKQNYFCIITGTEKDDRGKIVPKYLVISKGDLGQMSWNPIEFGLDRMWEKDQESVGAFLVNYLSDLSPVEFARKGEVSLSKAAGSLLPPIVKGAAEDWANLNFYTGNEVIPYYLSKNKPPELQYKENTPENYKKLGRILGISPLRLQNFAQNVFAGYGREGLDPSAMWRGLTGRLMRTTGGEIESRAFIAIKDIEQGYITARAYAQEMVDNGERNAAVKLMNEWNKGLDAQLKEYNKQFSKYGFQDKGGLKRSYIFSPEKRRNILSRKQIKISPLERRLNRRGR